MALFTTADRDAVKTALITAATEGIASVSISGQSVQSYTLDQLQNLLAMIQGDLASDAAGSGGIRTRQIVPPACG